jgi:glycosyltransferase involved in cell wall biosynthesis
MLISVVTPSYNRAHTLEDAYLSLLDQEVDLEWVVVDDGSTDDTGDLVADLRRRAPFPVRYARQDRAGAHAARNRGVAMACGELVALLDSDDMLRRHGLARVAEHWTRIPEPGGHAGVTSLCVDETGRLVGDPFPAAVVDATWQEMTYGARVRGEKFMTVRTDVLRAHPFRTDPPGFVGESDLWRRLGRRYRTRYVNDVVRVYRLSEPSRICRRPFRDNAAISALAHADVLNDDIAWLRHDPASFLRSAAHLARALFHQGVPFARQPRRLGTWRGRALWAIASPLGWSLYVLDMRNARGGRGPAGRDLDVA